MIIRIADGVEGARLAQGVVVVIDVMRAFTTAAYAFAAGLAEIELVTTAERALAAPGFRMGESDGRLIPGFDHNNSPSQLLGLDLRGRRGVLRTTAGTRCVMEASGAREIWLGSLVIASATARAVADRNEITFVISGAPDEGEEDCACPKHRAADQDFPLEDIDCATAIG